MTMLKTYRKRRKQEARRTIRHERFLRLFGGPRRKLFGNPVLLPPIGLDQPLRWVNYTYQYTFGTTAEEFREQMRTAMKNHDFRQPIRSIEVPGSRRDEHCT